jgi:uncharacterized sulfatase
MNRRLVRTGVCAALLAAASLAAAAAQQSPNIVFIISDDHGWTDYGFMGHKQVETPCLDRLASQSLVFTRGYVPASLCCPSLAAIITGLYPHQNLITCNDPPAGGAKRGTPAYKAAFEAGRAVMTRHMQEAQTLPRLLAARGYLSFQTGKWWQGHYSSGGFTHGMTKGQRHGDEGLDIGRKTMQPIYDFVGEARKAQKPWFVWYAPMMPHDPHTPPERLLAKYKAKAESLHVARYWAMVEWFDETCGQLLDYLDREGLAENTLVIYVTDNGWVQSPDSPRPLPSKLTPNDFGLRTPILVRWPGKVAPRRCEDLAMSIDLVPTVLAALGEKRPPALQGVSLLDAAATSARKTIYGECFTHDAADLSDPSKNLTHRWVIDGWQKLIVPAGEGSAQLYDLAADPLERADRAAQQPEAVRALRAKLDAWWRPSSP